MEGSNVPGKHTSSKMISGLAWCFGERIAAQSVSTIVSIILARLLDPEHYGIISIVMIFISICNIFVSDGLGTVLVQKKDTDELDFNTMFITSLSLACLLYMCLYFFAPIIEKYYEMEIVTVVIRVLGLRLILTSVNTIQQAYIQRKMEFRKFFLSTFIGTTISAVAGIWMAYSGYGVWALVAQYLTNTAIGTIVLFFTCGWKPRIQFSPARLKGMLPFSLRVFGQSVVYTMEDNIRSLIIGKRFGLEDLAFYNKGIQFPQLFITNLVSSIGRVMLPSVAHKQDNKEQVKNAVRNSVSVGMYILSPVMLGFCAIGDTFVSVVLTDKWLPCVPYLRILCVAYMMRPFETTCSSSILALGRSDITLRNMIIVNSVALLSVVVAVFGFNSVLSIACGTVLSALVSVFLYAFGIQKLIGYRLVEQLKDCVPSLLISLVMTIIVYCIHFIPIIRELLLIIQIVVGILAYWLMSNLFRVAAYNKVKAYVSRYKRRDKN